MFYLLPGQDCQKKPYKAVIGWNREKNVSHIS